MCFVPKTPKNTIPAEQAQPEKVAQPDEIGAGRKAEDEALFGGVPDLRVDRSAVSGGAAAGGSGLKTMG
jgi:hypothetical protein